MRHKALALFISTLLLLLVAGATIAVPDDLDPPALPEISVDIRRPFDVDLPAVDKRRPSADMREASTSVTDYVYATAETKPLDAPPHDLDDPALWFNQHDPAESLIIGTNKANGDLNHAGLRTWNLDGSPVQKLRGLHANNVDVQDGFELNGTTIPIVLTVSRTEDAWGFRVFTIDTDPESRTYRELREISGSNLGLPYEPYGSALYHSATSGKWYAFVSSREGPYKIDQFELIGRNGTVELAATDPVRSITYRPSYGGTREIAFKDVIEGMTVDQARGILFANEEGYGLHRYGVEPDDGTVGRTIDTLTTFGGRIRPDAEGVGVVPTGSTSGFIVAVGQNGWERSRFEIYDRVTYEHIKSIEIVAHPGDVELDEVKGTDGIATYPGYLNQEFPCGIFIAHGDQVDTGESAFKLIPLDRIFPDRRLPAEECRDS